MSKKETILAGIVLVILLLVAIKRPTKGTIERWHDAIREGKSWNEYVKEVQG